VSRSVGRITIVLHRINDIEKVCPNVSRDMIRKMLRELRDAKKIESTSMGRGAEWVKKSR